MRNGIAGTAREPISPSAHAADARSTGSVEFNAFIFSLTSAGISSDCFDRVALARFLPGVLSIPKPHTSKAVAAMSATLFIKVDSKGVVSGQLKLMTDFRFEI